MLIESWTITCMRWLAAIRRRTIRMTGNQTKLNQFIQILCKFVWHCCHCQWTNGAGCTPPRFSPSRYFPILAQTSHFPILVSYPTTHTHTSYSSALCPHMAAWFVHFTSKSANMVTLTQLVDCSTEEESWRNVFSALCVYGSYDKYLNSICKETLLKYKYYLYVYNE